MKPILLAPAGNMQSLKSALENGADAVYIGAQQFSARSSALNFSPEEIEEAAYLCHLYNAKLHLAINIILSDYELQQAVDIATFAYRAGVDAFIVQDNGFARLCKEMFPDIEIHASTQMTIHSVEGAMFAKKAGYDQVVLSRELTLEEISKINDCGIATEIFVHGALCYCYSGKCLMSSIIGQRSGNRGKCAQPCRLPYSVISNGSQSKEGYYISPKDLCTVHSLPQIISGKINCLKIEGRMKNSEYVSVITSIYRKYIDSAYELIQQNNISDYVVDEKDIELMKQIFNRGGFTDGYLNRRNIPNLITVNSPKHTGLFIGTVQSYDKKNKSVSVISDKVINKSDIMEISKKGNNISFHVSKADMLNRKGNKYIYKLASVTGDIINGDRVYRISDSSVSRNIKEKKIKLKKTPASLFLTLSKNLPIHGKVIFKGTTYNFSLDTICESTEGRGITKERIIQQLQKTGYSPVFFESITIDLDNNISIPIASVNQIRRQAMEIIENQIKELPQKRAAVKDFNVNLNDVKKDITKLQSVYFYTHKDIDLNGLNCDRIYLPFIGYNNIKPEKETYLWIPPVIRGEVKKYIEEHIKIFNYDGIMVSSLDGLELCSKYDIKNIALDYQINVFNSVTLFDLCEKYPAINTVTVSVEMKKSQIENLKCPANVKLECVIYGRITVMHTAHCINGGKCSGSEKGKMCNGSVFELRDRLNYKFPIICNPIDCSNTILNSSVILPDKQLASLKDMPIDIFRLNIYDESCENTRDILDMYASCNDKKYSRLIEDIKSKGYTKGHFFRGV